MRLKHWTIPAIALLFFACVRPSKNQETNISDSATTNSEHLTTDKSIFARLQMDTVKSADSVMLHFNVHNPSDTVQQFCKWHTPFEPLMSKYLQINDEKGNEAAYQGPMAKRIMPPPAESYMKLGAGETISVGVDILKSYALKKGNKYTLYYTGQEISGVAVSDTLHFEY